MSFIKCALLLLQILYAKRIKLYRSTLSETHKGHFSIINTVVTSQREFIIANFNNFSSGLLFFEVYNFMEVIIDASIEYIQNDTQIIIEIDGIEIMIIVGEKGIDFLYDGCKKHIKKSHVGKSLQIITKFRNNLSLYLETNNKHIFLFRIDKRIDIAEFNIKILNFGRPLKHKINFIDIYSIDAVSTSRKYYEARKKREKRVAFTLVAGLLVYLITRILRLGRY